MNVAEPAETPVTTPVLVTVAMAGALLAQVPPLVGDKVVVEPVQMLLAPVMLTTGNGSTETGEVAAEAHPVAVLVYIKVVVPAATPVTTPVLVTVATATLLLAQVPPLVGDNVVVAPAQITLGPVILTGVKALTVTVAVVALQFGAVFLTYVNVTDPPFNPVTRPALVTEATVGLLLVHVPPVVGDNVVVAPTQIVLKPVILTTGKAVTVTGALAAETQPVLALVYVKVAVPAETPVTTPVLVTVATDGALLTHEPPVEGDKVVVLPAQILLDPVMLAIGIGLTVTTGVAADKHPLEALVKVKLTVPAAKPVTTPAFVTLAMEPSLLAQVPPEVGDTPVISPTQISLEPVRFTVGAVTIAIALVADWVQPLASLTVTVYVVLIVGLTTLTAALLALSQE